MPIYEFECSKCRIIFEKLAPMGSTGEGLTCPECGGSQLRKCISTFYGRSSDGHGASHSVGGGCSCGSGDCSSCTNCTCH